MAEEFCHSVEGWIKEPQNESFRDLFLKIIQEEEAQHTLAGTGRCHMCLWRGRKTIRFLSMMLFRTIRFAYRILKHTHVRTPTWHLQLRERGTQHSVFWKHKAKRFFLQRSILRLSHCHSNIPNSKFNLYKYKANIFKQIMNISGHTDKIYTCKLLL